MIRFVRTATLDALHADRAALKEARAEAEQAKTEAALATDSAIRAETVAERQLRDLAQALAARFQAERDRDTARDALNQHKADTEQQMAEIREDLAKLRAAAADTETGETVRAALAYNILRDLYADAWKEGLLPNRPFDLLAVVLNFDTADQKTATPEAAVAPAIHHSH